MVKGETEIESPEEEAAISCGQNFFNRIKTLFTEMLHITPVLCLDENGKVKEGARANISGRVWTHAVF